MNPEKVSQLKTPEKCLEGESIGDVILEYNITAGEIDTEKAIKELKKIIKSSSLKNLVNNWTPQETEEYARLHQMPLGLLKKILKVQNIRKDENTGTLPTAHDLMSKIMILMNFTKDPKYKEIGDYNDKLSREAELKNLNEIRPIVIKKAA